MRTGRVYASRHAVIAAFPTADVTDTHRLVVQHIAAVRKISGMEDAMAVLVLESNLAFEAQHLIHALNRNKVKSWVALAEGASGNVGWLTTNGVSSSDLSVCYFNQRNRCVLAQNERRPCACNFVTL